MAEIFQDLALLVEEQGAQIDNIQTNLETAANQTSRGVHQLTRAAQHQRKSRWRVCVLILCALALVGAIVVVLLVKGHGDREML